MVRDCPRDGPTFGEFMTRGLTLCGVFILLNPLALYRITSVSFLLDDIMVNVNINLQKSYPSNFIEPGHWARKTAVAATRHDAAGPLHSTPTTRITAAPSVPAARTGALIRLIGD